MLQDLFYCHANVLGFRKNWLITRNIRLHFHPLSHFFYHSKFVSFFFLSINITFVTMGGSNSKFEGVSWRDTEAGRKGIKNDPKELPTIPYLKLKDIKEEMEHMVRTSIWVANYKRAFRGYIRKDKPEKGQDAEQYRLHVKSKRDADRLGTKNDTYAELIEATVRRFGPIWLEDAMDDLKEKKKIKPGTSAEDEIFITECAIADVHGKMIDPILAVIAKRLYHKYSSGLNPDESDVELDFKTKQKIEKEKQMRLKKASEERALEASRWQEEAAKLKEEEERRLQALKEISEFKKQREGKMAEDI